MKYYLDFTPRTDLSVEPDNRLDLFDAGVGQLVKAFTEIGEEVEKQISWFLDIDEATGRILTAATEFNQRLAILSALAYKYIEETGGDTEDRRERVTELVEKCCQAEELRNLVTRSSWAGHKITSTTIHPRSGLSVVPHSLTTVWLQDAADFIQYLATEVEHLAGELEMEDAPSN
jgi:hypothetical protein